MRSNLSPRTGSKSEPSRTSIPCASLSSAFSSVIHSARLFTSVATTVDACVARWSAWTPQPVPRSNARSTGLADRQLGQRAGRTADAEDVVRTHPVGRAVQTRSQVADHPQVAVTGLVGRGVRPHVEARGHLAHALLEKAGVAHRIDQPGQSSLGGVERDRGLEQEQAGQALDRAAARRTPKARGGLVARQGRVGGRSEQLGDTVVGVVRVRQRLPEWRSELEAVHAVIVPSGLRCPYVAHPGCPARHRSRPRCRVLHRPARVPPVRQVRPARAAVLQARRHPAVARAGRGERDALPAGRLRS